MFTGEEVIGDFAFVVEEGTITWVGKREDLTADDFANTIDLSNRFVTPGFVDAHVHLYSYGTLRSSALDGRLEAELACRAAYNARKLLSSGIVACRDLGSPNGSALALRDSINKGYVLGPKVVAAGRSISATGGHGWYISIECDGPDEVRKGVRQTVKEGADVVKLMVSGGVNSLVRSGDLWNLLRKKSRLPCRRHMVWAAKFRRTPRQHRHPALRGGGADSIEHGVYLTEDIMEMMVERGLTWCLPSAPPLCLPGGPAG